MCVGYFVLCFHMQPQILPRADSIFKEWHDASENKIQKYFKPYAIGRTVCVSKGRKSGTNEPALFP